MIKDIFIGLFLIIAGLTIATSLILFSSGLTFKQIILSYVVYFSLLFCFVGGAVFLSRWTNG